MYNGVFGGAMHLWWRRAAIDQYLTNLRWLQIINFLATTHVLVSTYTEFYKLSGIVAIKFILAMSLVRIGSSWLFEIPSGWIADRWGRVRSIRIGVLICSTSAILISFHIMPLTITSIALVGCGSAFIMGADTALAAASARASKGDEKKKVKRLAAFERLASGMEGVSESAGAGVAALLFSTGNLWAVPWVSFATFILIIPCLFMIKEPPLETVRARAPYKQAKIEAKAYIKSNKELRWALHFLTSIGGLTLFVVWLTPVYYEQIYHTQEGAGWLWAAYLGSLPFWAWFVRFFMRLSLLTVMAGLIVAGTLTYAALSWKISALGLAAIFLLYGIRAFQKSLWKPYVTGLADPALQATVFSIQRAGLWKYYFAVYLVLMIVAPFTLLWSIRTTAAVAVTYCAVSLSMTAKYMRPRLAAEKAAANANPATETV